MPKPHERINQRLCECAAERTIRLDKLCIASKVLGMSTTCWGTFAACNPGWMSYTDYKSRLVTTICHGVRGGKNLRCLH